MSFLRRLFTDHPLLLRMALASEAVRVELVRDGHRVPRDELLSPRLAQKLPEPLLRFVRDNSAADGKSFLVPWPAAYYLAHDVRATESLHLDLHAVTSLQSIPRPPDFQ